MPLAEAPKKSGSASLQRLITLLAASACASATCPPLRRVRRRKIELLIEKELTASATLLREIRYLLRSRA